MLFKLGEKPGVRIEGVDSTMYPDVPKQISAVQEMPYMTKAVNEKVKFTIHCGRAGHGHRASRDVIPVIQDPLVAGVQLDPNVAARHVDLCPL